MDRMKLIVALVIVVIIFGLALYYENYSTDPSVFLNKLYNAKKSAILMDVSNSPKQQITTSILQCGVNFIAGGFYAKTAQEVEVYACDKNGCMQTKIDPNKEQLNYTNYDQIIPFDQAMAQIKNLPYIYIRYGVEQKFISHPNYLEVVINEQSDPKNCQLNIKFE
ncbi:MAG: hypothetical protein QXV64_02680 [Candidatus Anstonellaceae archaeon]